MPKFFDIAGKRCIVSGAGSGIGLAITERFAQAGAEVWMLDTDADAVRATCDRLNEVGGRTKAYVLDVGDAEACEVYYSKVDDAWPEGVEVLINNAGIGHKGTALETGIEDLRRLQRVNVEGVLNLSRLTLPSMLKRRDGCIINTASIGGVLGIRDRVAYCATKFAVVGLTKAMALDHATNNVRVNCICPARVHTPFVDKIIQSYDDPDAAFAEMSATQPIGRMAKPEEIAAAAHYLASDEASFLTGTALYVDGGFSAGR